MCCSGMVFGGHESGGKGCFRRPYIQRCSSEGVTKPKVVALVEVKQFSGGIVVLFDNMMPTRVNVVSSRVNVLSSREND
ncbi:hypothetical protein V6N12_067633 [Hibiscus sabdariffa]|uniref:Uncharacterized protein n=1 Tax=Hibiscus sabdariffa TaxID=183260 RepID=A0ABR1ZHI1_9ROSI